MGSVALGRVMQMAEAWPEYLQEELAAIAAEMDAGLHGRVYRATPEELAAIDEGIRAANAGEFATQAEMDALFDKYRPA